MREIAADSVLADDGSGLGSRPSEGEMREALSRVNCSASFQAAPRLQQFLSYVVEEAISGRGNNIKGKGIASDVYGRDLAGSGGQNLVRVEARRLRRRLGEYYADAGAEDPWRIVIDVGGYSPKFERNEALKPAAGRHGRALRNPSIPFKPILAAAVVLVGALAIRAAFDVSVDESDASIARNEAVRAAYRERSVQAVQAVNLAEQARGMFFPVFDLKRQEIALEMYRHAISLDPGLHHGYSGAAQVLAIMGLLSADAAATAASLDEATIMADKALEISPADPWAIAANGLATAVSGDPARGMDSVRIAVNLAPEDGHILDIAGVTSILSNVPQFAAETSDPERHRLGPGRFGANNIWGLSQLMLGNYDNVIAAFSTASESGAPVSAPSLIFLAVAHDHLGDEAEASRIAAELNATWPDFPVTYVVSRIFPNSPAFANDILERLARHGYPQD